MLQRDAEVDVEDEQKFLERQQHILQQGITTGRDSRGSPAAISKSPSPAAIASSLTNSSTPKKVRPFHVAMFGFCAV